MSDDRGQMTENRIRKSECGLRQAQARQSRKKMNSENLHKPYALSLKPSTLYHLPSTFHLSALSYIAECRKPNAENRASFTFHPQPSTVHLLLNTLNHSFLLSTTFFLTPET